MNFVLPRSLSCALVPFFRVSLAGRSGDLASATAHLLLSVTARPQGQPRVDQLAGQRKGLHRKRPVHKADAGHFAWSRAASSSGGGSGTASVAGGPLKVTRPRNKAAAARIAHLSKHLGALNYNEK